MAKLNRIYWRRTGSPLQPSSLENPTEEVHGVPWVLQELDTTKQLTLSLTDSAGLTAQLRKALEQQKVAEAGK